MAKRTPEQVLEALDAWNEAAIDAEMERALAMTPEEHENELRAAGVDVEAEKAKALAWRDKALRGEIAVAATEQATPAATTPSTQPTPETSGVQRKPTTAESPAAEDKDSPAAAPIPIARASSRRLFWTIGGVAAAASFAALYMSTPREYFTTQPNPAGEAAQLRDDAAHACRQSHWAECLKDLDEADRLDPDGADDPRVRDLRKAAQAAVGTKSP